MIGLVSGSIAICYSPCRIWFVHGNMNSYFVVEIAIHNRTVHRHADNMAAPGSVFNASAYHLPKICALFGTINVS